MFEFIYQTLTNFGYNHPVHPALTHVPIGMVMGAFIFVLIAVMTRKKNLAQTARHCSVLALIAAVPTALLGLMDWQHFYGGAFLFPIKMKLIMAGILIVFLTLAVIFGFFGETLSKVVILLYMLCLFSVIGLGYFGGYEDRQGLGVYRGELLVEGNQYDISDPQEAVDHAASLRVLRVVER